MGLEGSVREARERVKVGEREPDRGEHADARVLELSLTQPILKIENGEGGRGGGVEAHDVGARAE